MVGSPLAGDDKSANIAKSLKEQLDKIDLMSRNPNQKLEATQQKNQLFSTYLNKITSETKDAPILTLIVKQLKAMSYNAEFKKESVIRALDALSLPKETWESKVIDALKDKRSPLYKALNIKRYGLARLFSFFVGDENSGVSGTLMQLKKEINKLRESKRDDTKQKHKR